MSKYNALPLTVLAEQFARLPGIGMKTAQRLAYHVMKMSYEDAQALADAIIDAKQKIGYCSCCRNLSEGELCPICGDDNRNHRIVCVVESPKDIAAFERTGEYNGTYHVLHGLISPIDGVTPETLHIKELLARINSPSENPISEIIMATNPTVEGEATAMYLARLLKPLGIHVTRLAFGLPVGSTLEFADEVTLFRALENRSEM